MKQALMILTKIPSPDVPDPRSALPFSGEEQFLFYQNMLWDIAEKMGDVAADLFVFYTPDSQKERIRHVFPEDAVFLPQYGRDIGERMRNAFGVSFRLGYEKSILIGSDCPQIDAGIVEKAFQNLDEKDIVINPAWDGGFYLIGMKEEFPSIWEIERYGTNTVIYDILQCTKKGQLKTAIGQMLYDIDTKEDLRRLYLDIVNGIITDCLRTERFLRSRGCPGGAPLVSA